MPPVVSGGIGNDYALLVCQQILIPASGGVEAAALGVEHLERGVGLIGLDDLAEDFHLVGVAQVGGAGGDQVPVVLDVQTVVGEDGVARRQAEVEGVVVVDDGGGNIGQTMTFAFSSLMVTPML